MVFEIALRRPLILPSFAQQGDDNPRPSKSKKLWSHTLGGDDAAPFGKQQPEQQNAPDPGERKTDRRGVRELSTIPPGEVDDSFSLYQSQLIPTNEGALLRKNNFYIIPLRRQTSAPSFIFGRVTVAMPSDGYIQDVEEVELAFPQANSKPERIVLEAPEINLRKSVQSYRFRVKVFCTREDRLDFLRYENRFAAAGFELDFGDDLVELLDSCDLDNEALPWFHVIGSGWFASFSPELQENIRGCLWKLSSRDTFIINYHLGNYRSLNDELDYQYRLSNYYLTNPKTPEQTLQLIKTTFNKIFADPSSKSRYLSNLQERT